VNQNNEGQKVGSIVIKKVYEHIDEDLAEIGECMNTL